MGATSVGCWTCRVRHRKCDETHPMCQECRTRGLQCHGYGEKPQWMRNDAQLQAELSRIKQVVKENFRRVKRLQNSRPVGTEQHTQSDPGKGTSITPSAATEYITSDSIISQEASYREAELSAYYLDYLFPFLYPYYRCDPVNGGRGWLFWLLSHNPPLRQAALSVAALHQRASCEPEDRGDQTELLEYHTSALSGLRQALCVTGERYLTHDPDEFIKLLACGCSLISFEVCQGDSNEWQRHLNALISVACKITPQTFASATLCESTTFPRRDAATNLRQGRRRALAFLIAQVLWFEILASASTGAQPRLPYRIWLNSGCVDMADVMGCDNRVMEAIGDIATLGASKYQITSSEFCERKSAAEQCLLDGMEPQRLQQRLLPMARHVSLIFANAALVWCHFLTNSSTRDLGLECRAAVMRTIDELSQAPEFIPLRGLVWPICIAGSLASRNQRSLVREVMDRTSAQANTSFGNCDPVRGILEHCWATGVDWRTAMSATGNYVLLI